MEVLGFSSCAGALFGPVVATLTITLVGPCVIQVLTQFLSQWVEVMHQQLSYRLFPPVSFLKLGRMHFPCETKGEKCRRYFKAKKNLKLVFQILSICLTWFKDETAWHSLIPWLESYKLVKVWCSRCPLQAKSSSARKEYFSYFQVPEELSLPGHHYLVSDEDGFFYVRR